jgi:hypothetical protein
MSNRVIIVGAAILLGGACTDMQGIPDYACQDTVTSCRVVQSEFYGYQRACTTTCTTFGNTGRDQDDDDDDDANTDTGTEVASTSSAQSEAAPASAEPGRNLGAAPAPDMTRYSAFEGECQRDSQCGPGKCVSGSCYYGCQSDAQCGSGDRCSVESGVRVCQPDPNPAIVCTRSAQCDDEEACLNGGCRQTCTSTEQCTNLLDRCANGFCIPDRRPLGECVVNSECDDGLVCLDGSCVPACPADEQASGVCLAEPSRPSLQPAPEDQTPNELPTPTAPAAPSDEGSDATPSDEAPATEGDAPNASDDAPASSDEDVAPAPDDGEAPVTDDGDEAAAGAGDSDASEESGEPASDSSDPEANAPIPLAG